MTLPWQINILYTFNVTLAILWTVVHTGCEEGQFRTYAGAHICEVQYQLLELQTGGSYS